VDIGAAVMNAGFQGAARLDEDPSQLFANRIRKCDMSDNPTTEKGVSGRLFRAINKLVREDDIARFILSLQRTDGTHADDPRDAQLLHGPNVGAMIQLAG